MGTYLTRLRLIKYELGPYKRTAKLYCSRLVRKDGHTARELLLPVTIIRRQFRVGNGGSI
jgi:hypothetical protein